MDELDQILALNRATRESGLKRNDYTVLLYLHTKGPCNVGDIVTGVSMLPAAVTRCLNSLEDTGLIERVMDRRDRRSFVVSLTSIGEDKVRSIRKVVGS